jgi:hypothetical protein
VSIQKLKEREREDIAIDIEFIYAKPRSSGKPQSSRNVKYGLYNSIFLCVLQILFIERFISPPAPFTNWM